MKPTSVSAGSSSAKSRRRRFGLGLAAAMVVSPPAWAGDTERADIRGSELVAGEADRFEIEGSIRARYETYRGGFRPSRAESEDAIVLRSILKARYKGEHIEIGARLQDARAYLVDQDTPVGTGDVNTLELVELYAAIALAADAELTVGRQTISLGSKRLVGDPGFRNSTNGFTGARLDWRGDGSFTAFYVLPQQRLPNDRSALLDNAVEWDRESDDLRFWGAFYQRDDIGPFTAEAYVFGLDENDRDDRATRNRHLVTPGVRIIMEPQRGRLDTEIEAIWQTGSIRSSKAAGAAKQDVDAQFLHGELGYTLDGEWRPRLAIVGDLASGDDANDEDYGRFDPLFGPRRELGPTGLYGPLARTNLRAIGATISARPHETVSADVTYRQLWLDSRSDAFSKTGVKDPDGRSGSDAGYQIDGRLRWKVIPGSLSFEAGAALLGKGRLFDLAPNSANRRDTVYGYSSVQYNF
ncbi:MAG: alginate export family protein [Erythrobacter sp.]